MTNLEVFSSIVLITAFSLTTVFSLFSEENLNSGLVSMPCNFSANKGRSCLNCNTRFICKSIGGLVKPCRKLDRPHCVNGRCIAHPSKNCSVSTTTEPKTTMVYIRGYTVNAESITGGSSTTSSNFENNTTEGGTAEGGTTERGTTEAGTSEVGTTDDTSDENESDSTSKGMTDENATTGMVSEDITDNDEVESMDSTENDE